MLAPGDNTNAELAALSVTGVPVRLSSFTVDKDDSTKFTAKVSTAEADTLVTAQSKDPAATITVNGAPIPKGGAALHLRGGENTITIGVTAVNGTEHTYELTVERTTSDPDSGVMTYAITATAGEGGSIAPAGKSRVRSGADKPYTITPNEGYIIDDVLVDGKSVGKVTTYTFKKVKTAHTIEARFAPWVMPFADVRERAWYSGAVAFVARRGLMEGTGKQRFSPMDNTSRATVIAVLYRMAGSPAVTAKTGFTDAPAGAWYSDAVAWAEANGVAQGSKGKLMPNFDVTREQLAQFFYHFAKLQKDHGSKTDALEAFSDAPTGWSREAMAWAVGSGIMGGKGKGILDPGGKATRAELAVMLMRFEQAFEPESKP